MKMLVAAVAFATLVASPALAQSYDPHVGSGNIVPQTDAANYLRGPLYRGNYRAFARVPGYRPLHGSPAAADKFTIGLGMTHGESIRTRRSDDREEPIGDAALIEDLDGA